jgi:hypothetical protein
VLKHGLTVVLVVLNLATWGLAVPASAGAQDTTTTPTCPAAITDTGTTSQDAELGAIDSAVAQSCTVADYDSGQVQQWSEFGTIVLLTVGLVLIVAGVAVCVVVLWR